MKTEDASSVARDLAAQAQDWLEVIPDEWFYADQLIGKEVSVTIAQALEVDGERYLTFSDDGRKLRLARGIVLALKALFGTSDKCLGKTITITSLKQYGRPTIVVLDRRTAPKAPKSRRRKEAPTVPE